MLLALRCNLPLSEVAKTIVRPKWPVCQPGSETIGLQVRNINNIGEQPPRQASLTTHTHKERGLLRGSLSPWDAQRFPMSNTAHGAHCFHSKTQTPSPLCQTVLFLQILLKSPCLTPLTSIIPMEYVCLSFFHFSKRTNAPHACPTHLAA
ncbi:hypothetical protein Micbo1qcDRAFT_160211 [Microdochium bolleyi]|uniref:Uncharacterized protein n=1 Tax=Microdochium bolleyi TaxID=196109 RepID=A0A136JCQ1_9PEZI|nr:hypothetical protein Micbo1qcDRAFT_160211 [Microdochium bolleyi]